MSATAEDIARYESIINALSPIVTSEPVEADELTERTWHVAVTNPNCEGRVVAAMHERGIPTVAPVIRYWRKHKRSVTKHTSERALMPRYVIFGLAKGISLVGIEGVEHVVQEGGAWARMPAHEVSRLRLRLLTGEFDPTAVEPSSFIRWLVDHGEMPLTAIITMPEQRTKRNRVSRAARKRWRKKA